MKKTIIYLIALVALAMGACDAMDDNYKDYLTNKVYSPKIDNLTIVIDSAQAILYWNNPSGDVAQKIYITYNEQDTTIGMMVDSCHFKGLEPKGYSVSVYTLDQFDNLSVPVSTFVFPDGSQ